LLLGEGSNMSTDSYLPKTIFILNKVIEELKNTMNNTNDPQEVNIYKSLITDIEIMIKKRK